MKRLHNAAWWKRANYWKRQEQIISGLEAGITVDELSRIFGISRKTVFFYCANYGPVLVVDNDVTLDVVDFMRGK